MLCAIFEKRLLPWRPQLFLSYFHATIIQLQFANGNYVFSIFFLSGGDAICLAFKYDLKVITSFLTTYFETLNPIVEGFTFVGHGNMFGVEISFNEFFLTFVVGELVLFIKLSILHVKIFLLGGEIMEVSFQM